MPINVRITIIVACTIGALVTLAAAQFGETTGAFTIGALAIFMACLLGILTAGRE